MAIFALQDTTVQKALMRSFLAQLAPLMCIRVNPLSQIAYHAWTATIMTLSVNQVAKNVDPPLTQPRALSLANVMARIESLSNRLAPAFAKTDTNRRMA
jgi:hypothetical protein